MQTLLSTSVTAGGQQVEILDIKGFTGGVLPNTSASGVILTKPLPTGASEVVLRTDLYDGDKYADILTPTLTIQLQ